MVRYGNLSVLLVALALVGIVSPAIADESAAPKKTAIKGAVHVPMTIDDHLPAVEIMVNGQGPFHFDIDTGAAACAVVTRELADKLKMTKVGEAEVGDPSGTNNSTTDLVAVKSIEIGGVRFEGITAAIDGPARPGSNFDGILGFPLFHDLLVTFDYPRGELRLEPGSLRADDKATLHFNQPQGIPEVEGTVADQPIKVHIDSGAPGGLALPISLKEKLPIDGELQQIGKGRTVSNEFRIFGATLNADFRLGEIVLAKPRIEFVEILPHAHLGYRFLKDYAMTFDERNGRVRFVRGGS